MVCYCQNFLKTLEMVAAEKVTIQAKLVLFKEPGIWCLPNSPGKNFKKYQTISEEIIFLCSANHFSKIAQLARV